MLTRILTRNNIKITTSHLRTIYFKNSKFCAAKVTLKEEKSSLEEFTPIYKFPYIRALGILSRLKVYQTFVTCLAVPGSIILNQSNLLSGEGILVACSIGLSGCMILYSLSYFTQNVVGFVYVNKTGSRVKISYLDYWGRRKDEIIDTEDIVPLSDLPAAFTDGLYLKLSQFSANNHWKLNVRLGVVVDKDKFKEVFK